MKEPVDKGGHWCGRAGVLGDVCLEGTCLELWAGGSYYYYY